MGARAAPGGAGGSTLGSGAGGAGSGGTFAHSGLASGTGGRGSSGGTGGGGGGGGMGGASIGLVLCDSTVALPSSDADPAMTSAERLAGKAEFGVPSGGGLGGAGGYPDGATGLRGVSAEILDGCGVTGPAAQLAVVRADAATRWQLPGDASLGGAGWDTCDPGYTVVLRDFQSNGFWLCAADAYADARWFVANGTAPGGYRGVSVQLGNESDWGPTALGECPFGRLLGMYVNDDDAAWVCVEPRRKPTAMGWSFVGTEMEGWNPKGVTMRDNGGYGLVLEPTEGDPWLDGPTNLALDASYTQIEVSMMNETPGTEAQLFFWRAGEGPAEERSVRLPLTTDTANRPYYFDMGSNAGWTGTIRGLRLDFTNAAGGRARINFIRVNE
ncbi:MAG: hypothetical protein H6745_21695 [Deltaproteobacteria bacterium]|nr:hypothetical protein [Deltaproteobacteria bacterium]